MKNRFCYHIQALTFLTLCLLSVAQFANAAEYRLDAQCTRESAVYKKNELIAFRVKLVDENDKPVAGRTVSYVLSKDGFSVIRKGTFRTGKSPSIIRTRLNEPGFVRLELNYNTKPEDNTKQAKVFTRLGAGVDPLNIPKSFDVPKDFDAFWQQKKEAVYAETMKPVLTPVKSKTSGVEAFDVQIATPGSGTSTAPLSGYYVKPANAKAGSCPALIIPHSAGVRSSRIELPAGFAAKGFIALDFNAHGLPNGKPASFYKEQSSGALRGYPAMGKLDRDESYFTGMYMRLIRALEFIKAQPEWDGKILVVRGSSQGGGQALVAAGLDPDVTLITASVPAMCDHGAYEFDKMVGWPRLAAWTAPAEDKKDDAYKATVKTGLYVDAANFATRIKAQVLISVGFADHVCCPTSVYTAYNNIPHKNKRIINVPLMGHSFPKYLADDFDATIDQHVKDAK